MSGKSRRIALVILEDEQGRVALQLRSNSSDIANPDKWGLFGGQIEEGEEPSEGAQHEVEEELTCKLISDKLNYLWKRERETEKSYFLFRYVVTTELDEAELTEGQRYDFFWPSQIHIGTIEGREIVPYHRDFLLRFWNGESKTGES